MTLTAVMLLILAAATHASWNLLAKRQRRPSASFFLVANLVGFVALLPLLVTHRGLLADFPLQVWALLVLTGFFLGGYYCCLAGAYHAGDMSVAYPLARSSPIIVVTVVTLVLGRREELSLLCVVGIMFVVCGCFLIPMKRFSDIHPRHYLNATCMLALLAAFGTAGYSMVDDEALRQLRAIFGDKHSTVTITLVYACMLSFSSSLWLVLFIGLIPSERGQFRRVMQASRASAMLTGLGIYGTYSMVLVSMAFVQNVSYVVAFRQLSIPLGAALGILLLGEAPWRPKLTGIGVMCLGLFLVALG